MSFVFMMLLAAQYALQPRLSRRYISPRINKQSVALVEEIVKTGMAAAIFFAKPAAEVQSALKGEKDGHIRIVGADGNGHRRDIFLTLL